MKQTSKEPFRAEKDLSPEGNRSHRLWYFAQRLILQTDTTGRFAQPAKTEGKRIP
ncbi:hypothetical protein HMPREF3201_01234 [Megasphaera sp. MJR8396C]|nr:hypothetical protein HMPREF3201_01234 [Megasphaera sp. MJR8396C]